MEFNFLELQEKRNLISLEIPSKKDYFFDLFQLENSFVSRVDVIQIANTSFLLGISRDIKFLFSCSSRKLNSIF